MTSLYQPSNDPKLSHGHWSVTPKCNGDNQISYQGRNSRRGGRWLRRGVRRRSISNLCHRQDHLPSSIDIFEAKSFTINPTGYILELGISFGILAFSGLNFVQTRHCNGGMSPGNRPRNTGTQCLASSNCIIMAELQQVATTRLVVDFSSILYPFRSSAPFKYLMRSFR